VEGITDIMPDLLLAGNEQATSATPFFDLKIFRELLIELGTDRKSSSDASIEPETLSAQLESSLISSGKEKALPVLFAQGAIVLVEVVLNSFVNPDGLVRMGDNVFADSAESGQALQGIPGSNGLGRIVSGAVEQSNVDLGKEFVDMIITQRAFQANSRAITTNNEMLQELVNLKR
jgi:flagellar hook protein FlgE